MWHFMARGFCRWNMHIHKCLIVSKYSKLSIIGCWSICSDFLTTWEELSSSDEDHHSMSHSQTVRQAFHTWHYWNFEHNNLGSIPRLYPLDTNKTFSYDNQKRPRHCPTCPVGQDHPRWRISESGYICFHVSLAGWNERRLRSSWNGLGPAVACALCL